MKKYSIKSILTIVYLIFMFSIALSLTMRNKEIIRDKSEIAFLTAIDKEKKSFISDFIFKYKSEHSPNSVSADDKINWAAQTFLTMEDSCRHKLDSIFREEIINQGLNLNTSISCTYNGKTTSSIEKESIVSTKITHERKYQKDNNKETDIILKAYVYLPLNILIANITLYILISLNIIGLMIYIYIKKHRRKQIKEIVVPIETDTRTADNAKWIIINNDLLWDENNYIIKKGEKTIILKGESLRFFRLFLKNESFFLKYQDIYKSYGLKSELPEFKDRIYHSIKELKKDLTDVNINIKSIRGIGYQLTFH